MELGEDPIAVFRRWRDDARERGSALADHTVLATATTDGVPAARAVLIRSVDQGFVFYTSYDSRKGRELGANPRAAMCTVWTDLGRQVRIEGTVHRVDRATSEAYWRERPRGAQLTAAVSRQSEVIGGREELETAIATLAEALDGAPVPRPDTWGGYRLLPAVIEFWVGRDDRVHDRVRYRRSGDGWTQETLAP